MRYNNAPHFIQVMSCNVTLGHNAQRGESACHGGDVRTNESTQQCNRV